MRAACDGDLLSDAATDPRCERLKGDTAIFRASVADVRCDESMETSWKSFKKWEFMTILFRSIL